MTTQPTSARSGNGRILATAVVALMTAIHAVPAAALPFESDGGDWQGSWDTTLSWGGQWRVQGRDCEIIATSNGGCGRSANIDDGNLNYDTGLISNALKFGTELEVNFRDSFGIFLRGGGFYDFESGETLRTELSESAEGKVEADAYMLDYFAFSRFSLGSVPVELRVGDQVISWGESTFIQNGINITNPFDVARLRLPGSELKEALVPQGMVYANISPTQNLSFEGYYQYEWEEVEPDPTGTYFSNNDFAVQGGRYVMLGFGAWSDQGTDWSPLGGDFYPTFNFVPRADTRFADDEGQFGLAARYFAENLMGGMEFGLYFMRFHSRLPLINGITGTQEGFGNAAGSATAIQAAALGLASGLSFDAAVNTAAARAVAAAAALGGSLDLATATGQATVGANLFQGGGDVAGVLGAFAADALASTSRYYVTYPENLELYGFSWSGYLGNTGIAWQGEVSFKPDTPLQADDVELLFAALSPLDQLSPTACATNPRAVGALGCFNQLGAFGLNQNIKGYIERDVWQFQTTLTYLSGPLMGADTGAFVWEGGVTWVDDFPDPDSGGPNGQGLRLNGEGTSVSGNQALASRHFGELDPRSAFPHETSWGYRLRASLIYNNAIGPWTVSPIVGWSHDVDGNSPGPGGNFIEDRRALSLSLKGTLRNTYEVELNYALFDGAGKYNTTNDRDFLSLTGKVSF